MDTDSKAAQLITKLIRETAKDKVLWKVRDIPRALDHATEQVVPLIISPDLQWAVFYI